MKNTDCMVYQQYPGSRRFKAALPEDFSGWGWPMNFRESPLSDKTTERIERFVSKPGYWFMYHYLRKGKTSDELGSIKYCCDSQIFLQLENWYVLHVFIENHVMGVDYQDQLKQREELSNLVLPASAQTSPLADFFSSQVAALSVDKLLKKACLLTEAGDVDGMLTNKGFHKKVITKALLYFNVLVDRFGRVPHKGEESYVFVDLSGESLENVFKRLYDSL